MGRPLSISIISVVAVGYGTLSLLPKVYFAMHAGSDGFAREVLVALASAGAFPVPGWLHLVHALAGSVVWVACGLALWRGRSWARWLMLGWGTSVLLLTFNAYGLTGALSWKSATFLLLAYFLFNGRANAYLAARRADRARADAAWRD